MKTASKKQLTEKIIGAIESVFTEHFSEIKTLKKSITGTAKKLAKKGLREIKKINKSKPVKKIVKKAGKASKKKNKKKRVK